MPGRPVLPRTVAAAATVLLVAGCSGTADVPEGTRTSPPAAGRSAGAAPPTTEPLVFAVHATRRPLRISVAQAQRLRSDPPLTWHGLQVVAAPGTAERGGHLGSAAAARRAVVRNPDVLAMLPASAVNPSVRALVVGGVDPLRDADSYVLRMPGPPAERVTTLTVIGDLMLGRRVGAAAGSTGDPIAPLRPLQEFLESTDLTVGNLESTLSRAGAPRQGEDSFAAPPSVVPGLAAVGFDALSLANNHSGDYGKAALLHTLRAFAGTGVAPFGAGRDLAAASRPVVLTRHGLRFGFVGFNAIGETPRATPRRPGALSVRMPPRTGPLVRVDLRRVLGLVRDLAARVDVVVVLPHWGTQYTHVAEPVQTHVGRRLVDAGADLVVGGHPHWVQGVERHRSGVIVHSLGNFVFDMDFMQQTQEGVTLTATFWGARLKAIDLTPYRLGADFAPRPATGAAGAAILADVWRHSTGPFRAR